MIAFFLTWSLVSALVTTWNVQSAMAGDVAAPYSATISGLVTVLMLIMFAKAVNR